MKIPSIVEMLEAGVHFGHKVSRWHPKMEEYIFTQRNGVHVIDLELTQTKLGEALSAARALSAQGKMILFVTTKPQGQELVKQAAILCGMPYLVERWMGGLLTNFVEIKKLIKKYLSLKGQQTSGELARYTKAEQVRIGKELQKMDITLSGLASLTALPDALFIPSMQREKTAVTEANRMNVPVFGVCDTNANPLKATYAIPANDDAVNSIKMVVGLIAEAIKEGRAEFLKNQEVAVKEAASKKAELRQKVKGEMVAEA